MLPLPVVLSRTEMDNAFLGNLVQVCFVTDDHERTLRSLVNLGIGPWRIRTFDRSNLSDTTFRGKPSVFSAKVCLADVQNMNWEVVQPLDGPSIYAEFLERHGEGIQHLAFDCRGVPYAEKVRLCMERGYEAVQSGVYAGGVRFHYFDTGSGIVEVFDVPTGFVFPPAERWFPSQPVA